MLSVVVAVLAVLIIVCRFLVIFFLYKPRAIDGEKILLVVAHPDDEAMFFAPFVLEAVKQKKLVHLLTLSEGIGSGRKEELLEASKVLGISHVAIYGSTPLRTTVPNPTLVPDSDPTPVSTPDHPPSPSLAFPPGKLNDGFNEKWSEQAVSYIVDMYCKQWDIDTIVTFDATGVSGHPNHIQTFKGVRHHQNSMSHLDSGDLSYFHLSSPPLPQKYLSWVGVMWELIRLRRLSRLQQQLRRKSIVILNSNPVVVWKAMGKHRSQMVWYRWLYLMFSSLVYMNVLVPVKDNKVF